MSFWSGEPLRQRGGTGPRVSDTRGGGQDLHARAAAEGGLRSGPPSAQRYSVTWIRVRSAVRSAARPMVAA